MLSYKSKIHKNQLKRAVVNIADIRESNRLETKTSERIRKLRQRRRLESPNVASELGVASTCNAEQAISINTGSEQFIQSEV